MCDNVIFRAKPSTTCLSEEKNKVPKVFNDFRDFKEYLILLLHQNFRFAQLLCARQYLIKQTSQSLLSLNQHFFSVNDVDALDRLCYLAAAEVINTFHLYAFSFYLLNACCLALLYRE